jgi:uncharacterized protein (DUF58 family)
MVMPALWTLLAALALVLSWSTGAATFAWAGYFMLAALLAALLLSRLAPRGLAAARTISADRITFGGRAEVEVTVENRSRLPVLWLAAAEALPAGLPMQGVRGQVGPIGPRRRFRFHYTLRGARRGYHQVGPTLLRTGDLFGLAQRERTGASPEWLTVYPKIVPMHHAALPSRRPAGDIRARPPVLEDPTRVVGVRPYQHGDGLRRVHWRATAHTGRLQSKLFEVSAQLETVIILNLRRSDYIASPTEAAEDAELAIVAASSIAHHVLERRQRTGLLAFARDPAAHPSRAPLRIPAGRGREQLARILSLLGRIELGATPPLPDILRVEKAELPRSSLIVIITPHLDRPTLSALLDLRTAGFGVYAILVGRLPLARSSQAALRAMTITPAHVRSEADIRALGL